MKSIILIHLIFLSLVFLGCEKNDKPEIISASATATRNDSGEIVVRDASQSEIDSINLFKRRIEKINKMYPAPQIPLNQQTFAVESISDDCVFLLENGVRVKMSGIKCLPESAYYLRKFFKEDTERLLYLKEKQLNNGIVESIIWLADSSLMQDPELKEFITSPSYSGMNDTVILSNWCEIDQSSNSKYLSRYEALYGISKKHER